MLAFLSTSFLLLNVCHPTTAQSLPDYPLKAGPFLDKVIFEVIGDVDELAQALIYGEIDLMGTFIDEFPYSILFASENIEIDPILENGYYYAMLNVYKYPFNITSFRRALAFALDKEGVSRHVNITRELPEPIDCVVPKNNPFSNEEWRTYNYYENERFLGNNLLDQAGFNDTDQDGVREAPNGNELLVRVTLIQQLEGEVPSVCCAYLLDALDDLGINATLSVADYWPHLNPLTPSNYDIIVWVVSFPDYDVDWLVEDDWAGHADLNYAYAQFPVIRNSSIDQWKDLLATSSDYGQLRNAAHMLQEYWEYECSVIPIVQLSDFSTYRSDRFENFQIDRTHGAANWWTLYKTHLNPDSGGPWGGTLTWGILEDITSFSFLGVDDTYSIPLPELLYDSLMKVDPVGNSHLWLAESFIIETHYDNGSVPEGHTRFTFNLHRNVTWTDGTPLTGRDVAFSLNFYKDAAGNPFEEQLGDIAVATSPTEFTVIVEFPTESYWNLHKICYLPIIPEHVFSAIGPDGWSSWNPQPPDQSMVTSGPFNVTAYSPGEYIELTRNPNYFYNYIPMAPPIDTHSWPSPGDQQIGRIVLVGTGVTALIVCAVVFQKEIRK
ncbi:MAG: ABC transporter substrate-binding protein [Candidatus Thorarchaeota archaeon]|jgi:ABC-type transport system substrate-binding protein